MWFDFRWIEFNEAKIAEHGITTEECEWVVCSIRPKQTGTTLIAEGRTQAGRDIRVVYTMDDASSSSPLTRCENGQKKPANTKPSDRYAAMTKSEYDREAARFEPPNELKGKPLSNAAWARMKRAATAERRKRGRPTKAEEEKVARVLVSMPRDLLAAIDAAASDRDVTRAALIADGMRRMLKLRA